MATLPPSHAVRAKKTEVAGTEDAGRGLPTAACACNIIEGRHRQPGEAAHRAHQERRYGVVATTLPRGASSLLYLRMRMVVRRASAPASAWHWFSLADLAADITGTRVDAESARQLRRSIALSA